MTGDEIKHPATVRMNRVRLDGSIKPFSVDEQWNQVIDWHSFLQQDRASEYPVLDGMNEAWEELEPLYQVSGHPIMERGAALSRVSSTPLSALFYMIDMGFYPPPELLLTLLDCWETYRAGGGDVSLEEAFLGKPVQKGGVYAKRKSSQFKRMVRQWEFAGLLREGKSRKEAAEIISERFGGRPEPESILREMRGFSGYKAKAEDPEK